MTELRYDVRIEGVSRSFRRAGDEIPAVRDVSLNIAEGEFVAIVGRSGSGKTTLLNLIAGLQRPDSGEISIGDDDITQLNERDLTRVRRNTIGFVFQSFGLLPLLSAEENIDLVQRIAGVGLRERNARTRELLAQVGLTARAHHRPYELSGGEQQRVAIARALANRPRVLIADEPTGELDTTTAAQIFLLLREIASDGVTIITATHDPLVLDHVDRIEELEDGRLLRPAERTFGREAMIAAAPTRTTTATPDDTADRFAPWRPGQAGGRSVAAPDPAVAEGDETACDSLGSFDSWPVARARTALTFTEFLASPGTIGIALVLITGLAAALRFYDLGRIGLGNLFYASAIRSMGLSWHNFLYAAYDPAGTLTVDKPPLALWLQVASSKLFGFGDWSLVLPIALAGTLAVPLTYAAAHRGYAGRSGAAAVGLIAALLLAVFPEAVGTARDSTMDAVMMALVVGGAWMLIAAVEGRRPVLLLAWAVLMGVVFNVKFFEGFMIAPAAIVYVLVRWRSELLARLPVIVATSVVVVLVSLSWVTFVELTPTDDRPVVMNDVSNSAYGLVARYNGLERVLPGEVTVFEPLEDDDDDAIARRAASALRFGVGDAGPKRLFVGANGPLLGTMAVLAIAGVAAALWRRRDWLDGPGLLWVGWGLTGVVLFSVSNRAPVHYTEAYAPAMAVLGAVGIVEAWRARGRWIALVFPLAALLTLGYARVTIEGFPPLLDWGEWAFRGGLAAAAIALVATVAPTPRKLRDALRALPAIAVVASMLVVSSWIATDNPGGGTITRPNPMIYARENPASPAATNVPAKAALEIAGEQGDARYAFAIDGINTAGQVISFTGASVLPLWSEYQRRPVLEAESLDALFRAGDVPAVLLNRTRSDLDLLDPVYEVIGRYCNMLRFATYSTSGLPRSQTINRTWHVVSCGSTPLN
jgi:putative ABC transport system ATP-binding protein